MLDTHAGAACRVSSSPQRLCCCHMQGVAGSWTTMLVPPAGFAGTCWAPKLAANAGHSQVLGTQARATCKA